MHFSLCIGREIFFSHFSLVLLSISLYLSIHKAKRFHIAASTIFGLMVLCFRPFCMLHVTSFIYLSGLLTFRHGKRKEFFAGSSANVGIYPSIATAMPFKATATVRLLPASERYFWKDKIESMKKQESINNLLKLIAGVS